MRNLKKILSLVLALMMVLSLMATASATSFVDDEDITYKEAVEVMSTLGILTGVKNEDGTYDFQPKDGLKRDAAAKILAYIVNGGNITAADVDGMINPFKDVKGWAEDVIVYCYNNGIVDGVNAAKDEFSPSTALNGYAFAKMLLVAIGVEGEYTGANWKLNVATAAKDAGLLAGLPSGFLLSKNITREEASQMAFNAMNYGETVVLGYPVKDSTGAVVGYYDSIIEAAAAAQVLNSVTAGHTYGAKKVTAKEGTLLAKNFKVTAGPDADYFGRPLVASWLDKNGNFVYAEYATPVAVFNTSMTEKAIFAAIGAAGIQGAYDRYIVMDTIYIDGTVQGQAVSAGNGQYDKVNSGDARETVIVAKNDPSNAAGFGNGVNVEIYATSKANHYVMVAVNEYVGTVYSVTPANEKAGTDRYITVYRAGDGYYTFETEDFAKGDTVLFNKFVYAGDTYLASVTTPEIASGKVTKVTNGSVYTIGGNTYVQSQHSTASGLTAGAENAWYLDSCGNIIANVSAAPTTEPVYYGVLVDCAQQSWAAGSLLGGAKETKEVVAFYNDKGEVEVLETAWKPTYNVAGQVNGQTFVANALVADSNNGKLFAYKLDANGKIKEVTLATVGADESITITKGNANTSGTYAGFMTNKTVVFYVDASGNVATYTGYANVASKTGNLKGYVTANSGNDWAALLVSVSSVNVQTATKYVYVKTLASTTESVVLPDGSTTTVTTYTDVYVNGVLVEGGMVFASAPAAGELYSFTTNTATGVSTLTSGNLLTGTYTVASKYDSYFVLNNTAVYTDSSTVYYEIDATTGAISVADGMPAVSATGAYTIKVLFNDKGTAANSAADVVVFVVE